MKSKKPTKQTKSKELSGTRKFILEHPILWALQFGALFCVVVIIVRDFYSGKLGNYELSDYSLLGIISLVIVFNIYYFIWRKKKPNTKEKEDLPVDASRRKFLTLSSSFAQNSAVGGVQQKINDGIAAVTKKTNPKSKNPIIPAGAVDFQRYKQFCNVCQACVEVCPTHSLKPSLAYEHLMLPVLSFNHRACYVDCVKCNEVCPTGALEKISIEDKTDIQIGYAVWLRENCIVIQDKPCRKCEEACPNGSIQMIQSGRFLIPIINSGRCLGCGACQAACPASPLKAIYVEGHKIHRQS